MNIISIESETHPLWQQLVGTHRSDVFHSPQWIQVLRDTYGLTFHAHIVLDTTGRAVAGMPVCQIDDICGERYVCLPFSDYCDPLVTEPEQWRCLADQILADHVPVLVRCLHTSLPLTDERFTLVKQARWHGLDLRPDLETLWKNLDHATHRAIKKAQRAGVVVRIAERPEDLRAFYELHLRVRKYKYQLLAQPYRFFEAIWQHFIMDQRGLLLLAEYGGDIIGGVLFLIWKGRLYYKFNASSTAHLEHRPNDLLIWEGMTYAKAKDLAYLDFGLSDWEQEGLIRYKRKFASEEKPISFLQHLPYNRPTEQERCFRALLPRLTNLLTEAAVPDSITEQAGEELYRFFT